jgi:mRNA interferase MazF
MNKDFAHWHEVKRLLDELHNSPTFKQREIWWCSIGLNIGHEENGKGKDSNRPVLILKKYNNSLFFGIPLTTKVKDNPFYHKISFRGKTQCAMLSQARAFTSKRITDKMGRVTTEEFEKLKKDFKAQF